jgi:hypothetical protein
MCHRVISEPRYPAIDGPPKVQGCHTSKKELPLFFFMFNYTISVGIMEESALHDDAAE